MVRDRQPASAISSLIAIRCDGGDRAVKGASRNLWAESETRQQRTPEYLGKRIGSRQIKLVSLYTLVMPALVLVVVEQTADQVQLLMTRGAVTAAGAIHWHCHLRQLPEPRGSD